MNRRDTVLAALRHEETRPIPYHIEFTGESMKKMVLATGKRAVEVEESVGSYLNYIQYWGWPTELLNKAEISYGTPRQDVIFRIEECCYLVAWLRIAGLSKAYFRTSAIMPV
jgi:hypothetical protein